MPAMTDDEPVLRLSVGEWLLGSGDPPPRLQVSVVSSSGTVEVIGETPAVAGEYELVRSGDID